MSDIKGPRITKRNPPSKPIKRTRYRKAISNLLEDFDDRCAYSLQHVLRAGGIKCMEVDHFNPHKKNLLIQDYDNLLPATRHCNGSKLDKWPSKAESAMGARFINPRIETDYGVHIVENIETGQLVGTTPAGKWQIRMCGLNASHLVEERKKRTKYLKSLSEGAPFIAAGYFSDIYQAIRHLREEVEYMIPKIHAYK